ncbi:ABC transporter permease subunit [Streptomyces sp. NPDC051642]|uniref:ABC transporter permease subunit n=1 Tax=unclassified Streptomyces TaxID=2593676 RepID=UPI003415CE0E
MNNIPDEVLEAARTEGAGPWRIAWHIQIPMIRQWIACMATMAFATGTQLFVEPQLVQTSSLGRVSPFQRVVWGSVNACWMYGGRLVVRGNEISTRRFSCDGDGGEHFAARSADADRASPAFLLKAVTAIAGVTRLMRLTVDRLCRSGLWKEGYEDSEPGTGEECRGSLRRRPVGGGGAADPLREACFTEVRGGRLRAPSLSCWRT